MDLIFGGWAFIGRFLVWNCFVVKDLDLTFKTYIISYFSNSKCTLVFTKEVPLPKEFHIKRFLFELISSFLSILFPWIWYTAIYKCNAWLQYFQFLFWNQGHELWFVQKRTMRQAWHVHLVAFATMYQLGTGDRQPHIQQHALGTSAEQTRRPKGQANPWSFVCYG
jgi:hypothetical protein